MTENITRRDALGRVGFALGAGVAAPAMAGAQDARDTPGTLHLPTWYYQHFDADYDLDVPEEAFGGWQKTTLDFPKQHTALVVMHAWDAGTREEFPGWWRCVPYIPRANEILRDVFPGLLAAVRRAGMTLFHVVGGGDYYRELPGYKRAVALADVAPSGPGGVDKDPLRKKLDAFRSKHVFVGEHNAEDVRRGFAKLDFPEQARPKNDEGVAENGRQLLALCKEADVNHLVYCGFAINWCLLLSPGGMAEMSKYGCMCSALRQATVAVENKDSARRQWCKELALWRVALAYGFVFDTDDFVAALTAP